MKKPVFKAMTESDFESHHGHLDSKANKLMDRVQSHNVVGLIDAGVLIQVGTIEYAREWVGEMVDAIRHGSEPCECAQKLWARAEYIKSQSVWASSTSHNAVLGHQLQIEAATDIMRWLANYIA